MISVCLDQVHAAALGSKADPLVPEPSTRRVEVTPDRPFAALSGLKRGSGVADGDEGPDQDKQNPVEGVNGRERGG
ncbi:MAG: hypothetical protein ACPGJE_10465 [Wenzhouxiangellaceae bacterium]